ncbi:hypothetical protein ACFSQE_09045 [Vogesella fluminis]|uniref:Uncharacterized protein n=1 Tax=Vogesella fluminis TaxID=1069161 RepID=A0ABQ2WBJ2_9NEIS|nr:hypothetical protein [Vogesella fluminis]GGW21052.1 hypothetical protein GCM10011419_30190 [Vogesella fluminis]
MSKLVEPIQAIRPTVIIELPLAKSLRILHPEQAILKIGAKYHDIGAFCYGLRSDKKRKYLQPREVVRKRPARPPIHRPLQSP